MKQESKLQTYMSERLMLRPIDKSDLPWLAELWGAQNYKIYRAHWQEHGF